MATTEVFTYCIIGFVAYVSFLLWCGWHWKEEAGTSPREFFISGRRFPSWLTFAVTLATIFSAVTVIGLPALYANYGVAYLCALWGGALSYVLGTFWLCPKLRRIAAKHDIISAPDMFAVRYGTATRILTALIIIFNSILYIGVTTVGVSLLFKVFLNIPFSQACVIFAIITAIYLPLGGFAAASWSDAVEGIIMFSCLALTVVGSVYFAGGIEASALNLYKTYPQWFAPTGVGGYWNLINILAYGLTYLFGQIGVPVAMRMYWAAKDAGASTRGRAWTAIGSWATFLFPVFAAIALMNLFPPGTISPDLMVPMFYLKYLGPVACALLFVGACAAVFSTTEDFSLMVSMSVMYDIIEKSLKRKLTLQQSIRWYRILTAIVCLLSIPFAIWYPMILLEYAIFAYGFNAYLGIVLIAGLLWKRANTLGSCLSLICGFLVSMYCVFTRPLLFGVRVHPNAMGILAAIIALIVGSYLGKPPPHKYLKNYLLTNSQY